MKRFYLIGGVPIFFVLTICCMEEPKAKPKKRCSLVYYQKMEILRLVKLHQKLGEKGIKLRTYSTVEDDRNYLCRRCLALIDEIYDTKK